MHFINENATCLGCGYRLAGLEGGTCPECGRRFDPTDLSTFASGRSAMGWQRWARPPSLIECAIVIVLMAWILKEASGAGCEAFGAIALGFPFFGAVLAFYVERFFACSRDRFRLDDDRQRRRSSARWVVLPVCTILIASVFVTPWPLLLRFKLSQSAFKQAVVDHRAGKVVKNQWIGLYYVQSVRSNTDRQTGQQMTFFATGDGFPDEVGFCYDPIKPVFRQLGCVYVAPNWCTYRD